LNSVGNEQGVNLVRGESARASGLLPSVVPDGVSGHPFGRKLGASVRGIAGRGAAGRARGWRGLPDVWDWRASEQDLPRLHLLVADEDAEVRAACVEIGRRLGFQVAEAARVESAQAVVRHQKVDLVLLDLKIAGVGTGINAGGMSLLEEVKNLHPGTSVIAMTTTGTVASAVETMRMGAEDYLTKPFALDDLVTTLKRCALQTHLDTEKRMLRERLRSQRGSGPLIGHSPVMEKLYRMLSKVAHSTHPALILGESGTGKELVGRSIHFNGPQAAKPFIPVDCGAVAPWLIEAELFGYVAGAYPGRTQNGHGGGKDGLLVSADGGTVFLSEIDELPLDLQAKLLRALQEKVVHPVGGTHTVPIAARILASSHADLSARVEQGKFRRDLYFRLNIVTLRIPALRQRKEDIPELAQFFLEREGRASGVAYTLSDEALRVLVAYDWPGNVRELESAIERACSTNSGPVLQVNDLPSSLQALSVQTRGGQVLAPEARDLPPGWGPEGIQSIAELERQAILGTIRRLAGDKLLAAKLLGIGKTTLYRKLKEYGIQDWDEN